MITIKDQNVNVEFSKDGNGVIAVRGERHILSLQQLIRTDMKVGDTWKEGDEQPLPKVELEFFKEESVDVLIQALTIIKRNLSNRFPDYALAC